jgi:hypothetical protein
MSREQQLALELKAARTAWLHPNHGVPISREFVRFAEAIAAVIDFLEGKPEAPPSKEANLALISRLLGDSPLLAAGHFVNGEFVVAGVVADRTSVGADETIPPAEKQYETAQQLAREAGFSPQHQPIAFTKCVAAVMRAWRPGESGSQE